MHIIDSAHQTVHHYPGGSESLAPRIGMSAAVLRNKVNPNNTTHHLTLAEADEIMAVTGDHRMLHALAAAHGYVLQATAPAEDAGGVMQALLRANAAEGDLDRVLSDALEDGLITPNELQQIAAVGQRQQEATLVLLAKLRAAAGRG